MDSFAEKGEKERLTILSKARLGGRTAVLTAKDLIINETFDEFIVAIEDLPSQVYGEWLRKVIINYVGSGSEVVIPATLDRELLEQGLLREINKSLVEAGKRGDLSLSDQDIQIGRAHV